MRHGRKERGVGFDEQSVDGREAGDLAKWSGLWKREDPRQRDQEAEIERLARFVSRATEAVHDAAAAQVRGAKDVESVCACLARVNDDGQIVCPRHVQLRFEDFALD